MIKAVLFDLDGTLINTNKLVINSFKHTFNVHLQKEVPEEEIIKTFGEPLSDTLKRYDPNNFQELIKTFQEYNSKMHDSLAEEFDGIQDGLYSLKNKGLLLGVVTSKRRVMAERGLKLFNMYDCMDVIVTPEDTKIHKPNPEPIYKACKLLNIVPQEVIMVGDSNNDILCGKNAGAVTCLVSYTALPIKYVLEYKPDFVIKNLIDIVEIIDKLNLNVG